MINLTAKGKSACAIMLSVGVGKMQIQGTLAKKILIRGSWKEGTNRKLCITLSYYSVRASNKVKQEWQPQPVG